MDKGQHDWITPPEWLSEQYLKQVLKAPLRRRSLEFSDFKIAPATNKGDNFSSQIFRITTKVSSRGEIDQLISLVAKILPLGESAQDAAREAKLFTIESKMLSETLPFLQKILDKANISQFFSTLYHHQGPPKEILIMEDLKALGFQNSGRVEGLDLQHMILVVESLAAFHASSLIASSLQPDLKENYNYTYWCLRNKPKIDPWILGALNHLSSISKNWQGMPENLQNLLENVKNYIFDDFYDALEANNDQLQVLIHGDAWLGNFMFKYERDSPVGIIFTDFQLSHYNSPIIDIMYLIFTSSKEYIIAHHVQYILERYHQKLSEVCDKLNFPIPFSLEEITTLFKKKLMYGFTMSLLIFPLLRATKTDVPNYDEYVDEDGVVSAKESLYHSELFQRGMKVMLPYFIEQGLLK